MSVTSLFPDAPAEQFRPQAAELGDVLLCEANALLRSLAAESVAAVVTDPPYGIGYHSNRHEGRNPHAPIAQDWNFQIAPFLRNAARVLQPGGAVYLFCRFDVYPLWSASIPPELELKNLIVWDKKVHTSGDLTGNFGFRHEIIMFLTKGRHRLRGYRYPNVWDVPKIAPKQLRMPAEKPVELYSRAIASSSDAGDLVVDPFGGSGTLAEAAIAAGRRFLVGDVDRRMVDMARARVGLAPLPQTDEPPAVEVPECPVFGAVPASPGLWGVHPEDIADWSPARVAGAAA